MEEENNLQLTADSLKCLEEFVNMAKDYSNPCELKPKEKFNSGLFARTYTLLYDNEAASGAFHNYCCSAIEGFIKTHFSYLEQRDSKEILEKFLETFKSFSTFSRLWSNALAHVDNMYIRFLNRGKTTTVKSMELFNTLIFEKFSGFIVENLINAINELRESESVQTDMIRDVISIFITCGTRNPITLIGDDDNTTKWGGEEDLRLYKEEFLKPFLSRTRLYYTNKFSELWET